MKRVSLVDVLEQAQAYLAQEKWNEVIESLRIALDQKPDDPHLLFFMAAAFMGRDHYGIASNLLVRAISVRPDMAEAWSNLGICYRRSGSVEKAQDAFKRSHEMGFPGSTTNLSACYVNEGEPEEGERWAREALERDPSDERASWNLALCLLEQKKWVEGFQAYVRGAMYEKRLQRTYTEIAKGSDPKDRKNRTPILTSLDDLKSGDAVAIYGEQGLGDEVMFLSCMDEFLNAWKGRTYLEVMEGLELVCRRTWGDRIEVYGTRGSDFMTWPVDRHVDWSCPVGNLPAFFRTNDEDFMSRPNVLGYLKPNEVLTKAYRQQLDVLSGGRPTIGIAWTGGIRKTMTHYRSLSLEEMYPLVSGDEFCWVSLQHDDDESEIEAFERIYGVTIHRMPEAAASKNLDRTMALLDALDMVVTVCCSVHHFAGAIGKPCYTLVPSAPAWRYNLSGEINVWYPATCRMFRQVKEDEGWTRVVEQVRLALLERF